MSLTDVTKDLDNLTVTFTADFAATGEQVWELWADPRRLEKWWGPPTYPATFDELDLTPGGSAAYYMTGPEGEKYRGWWRFSDVQAPTSLSFVDGFADESGAPIESMPLTTNNVALAPYGDGTRMVLNAVFDSREQMEQLEQMGMIEGMTEAMGQMDALLAGKA
jgi:uncharacterized protein YndB with AHSA1/START domain